MHIAGGRGGETGKEKTAKGMLSPFHHDIGKAGVSTTQPRYTLQKLGRFQHLSQSSDVTYRVRALSPEFDVNALRIDLIREELEYGGLRVRTHATLAKAKVGIVIDIGFGDAVEPGVEEIDLPVLLDLPQPIYHHHKLILDAAGHKLSKSRGDTSLAHLRSEGASPAHIRRLLGLP